MDRLAQVGFVCMIFFAQALVQVAPADDQRGSPQGSQPQADPAGVRAAAIVLNAIRANPLTAPYPIRASWSNGTVVLAGRVGTTQIHDLAVRTAIDLGYPVRDDLIIDTAEAHRVALAQAQAGPWSPGAWGALAGSAPYFVYPPPLFGRVDDPFFGFEPPLVSFPPWSASRYLDTRVPAPASTGAGEPPLASGNGNAGPIKGRIQLTVDMAGQVFLSGVVASEEDRRIIEEEARNTPGVTRVQSDLRVATRTTETPPPPPQPILRPAPEANPAPRPQTLRSEARPQSTPRPVAELRPAVVAGLAMARDRQKLTQRVAESLSRRPALSGLPITVQSSGDVVTLSGKVPSAYEAMLAYRTVEQTPGVRDIVDQLQFQLPDENHPNPLRQKGRPEDLESYLTSQIRRHVGDIAHVDGVRVRGDMLEVRGTLLSAEDQNRVLAILRSMPLLRDFRLEPVLRVE